MAAKKKEYSNESISQLKGADRVRMRPAVIFGSDGIEGCQHAMFEILSNSIDEAREGHGDIIEITDYGNPFPRRYPHENPMARSGRISHPRQCGNDRNPR